VRCRVYANGQRVMRQQVRSWGLGWILNCRVRQPFLGGRCGCAPTSSARPAWTTGKAPTPASLPPQGLEGAPANPPRVRSPGWSPAFNGIVTRSPRSDDRQGGRGKSPSDRPPHHGRGVSRHGWRSKTGPGRRSCVGGRLDQYHQPGSARLTTIPDRAGPNHSGINRSWSGPSVPAGSLGERT
jgi:hypothetical protein